MYVLSHLIPSYQQSVDIAMYNIISSISDYSLAHLTHSLPSRGSSQSGTVCSCRSYLLRVASLVCPAAFSLPLSLVNCVHPSAVVMLKGKANEFVV